MTLNPIFLWAHRLFLLVAAYSVSRTSFGLTSDEFCDDVSYLTNYVLTVEEGVDDFAKGFQSARKRTNDEMAEELIFIFHALDGSADMAGLRRFAVELLREFPTTNSIPFLVHTFQTEDNYFGHAAIVSYLVLSNYSSESIHVVEDFLKGSLNRGMKSTVYSRLHAVLDYGQPKKETKESIISFLLRMTERELQDPDWLDRILCKHLSDYEESVGRRETIKSVITNPNATTNSVQWAKSTLANISQTRENTPPLQNSSDFISTTANDVETSSTTSEEAESFPNVKRKRLQYRLGAIAIGLFFALIVVFKAYRSGNR